MRSLIGLLIVFVMNSCGGYFNSRLSEKVRIATELRSKAAKKMQDEMDLIPFGFGGQMMDQIKMLKLVFQYRHPVDIEDGRKLLMRAVHEFLDEINSNKKVRPYLSNYPFDHKNIAIIILLQKEDGNKVNQGKLTLIVARDGIFEYEVHDPHSQLLTTIYEETYEDALKIIKSKENSK